MQLGQQAPRTYLVTPMLLSVVRVLRKAVMPRSSKVLDMNELVDHREEQSSGNDDQTVQQRRNLEFLSGKYLRQLPHSSHLFSHNIEHHIALAPMTEWACWYCTLLFTPKSWLNIHEQK